MTRDEFFAWAERQEGRYEFDGFAPVAMTGGSLAHSRIGQNILVAMRQRLREPCYVLGPDAGVSTVGSTTRYPDAVVSCEPFAVADRLVPNPSVIFEVLSPTSGQIDRIVKLREYAAVPSLRRYVIVESSVGGLTVLERDTPGAPWTATTLVEGDALALPEFGFEVPVDEFYAGVPLADAG